MTLGQYNFFCSKCDHQLDTSGRIHLTSERHNGDTGAMYLSLDLGNYSYEHIPNCSFEKDELIAFGCPSCHQKLISKNYPEYTEMIMRVESKFDFGILFSRRAGIHKTYIITEGGVEKYGEHASDKL